MLPGHRRPEGLLIDIQYLTRAVRFWLSLSPQVTDSPLLRGPAVLHRMLRSRRAVAMALILICEPASQLLGQRVSVEGGGGFGKSTTSSHNAVEHGYLSIRAGVSDHFDVGIESFVDANQDKICTTACIHDFPEINGLVIPVSWRASRFSVGFGPGVFYLHGFLPEHLYVGGVAAHADVTVARIGPTAIVASVRPLLAPGARRLNDRIGVVPVTLGLRW